MLLGYEGIQRICLYTFGYQAHKKSVDIFNGITVVLLRLFGTRFTIKDTSNLPKNIPVLLVSNHQSMWDIPPIIWYLRRLHPKFVSKKELGKGIPSISFNLRHGGSILIDRRNARESLLKISQFAAYLNKTKRSGVIFPEGTRSRTGKPKKFAVQGLQLLFKKMPEALVVPVSINNSWKIFKYGSFPLGLGVHVQCKAHEPIAVKDHDPESLVALVERTITADIR